MYGHQNYSRFLTFVRILVDETNRDTMLSAKEILQRMEDYGYKLERKALYNYIKHMEKAGIIIERVGHSPHCYYYYKDGWI